MPHACIYLFNSPYCSFSFFYVYFLVCPVYFNLLTIESMVGNTGFYLALLLVLLVEKCYSVLIP